MQPRTESLVQKSFANMAEISKGMDTTTGHWEFPGCPIVKKMLLYPDGFPPDVIKKLIRHPIVYASGDSVFQIAAHEDVVPLAE